MNDRWFVEIIDPLDFRAAGYTACASGPQEARDRGLKLLLDEHPSLVDRELDVRAWLPYRPIIDSLTVKPL